MKGSMFAPKRVMSEMGSSNVGHAEKHDTHGERLDGEPDLAGRQPKRSSSFGRGLGGGLQSLTNGMTRAGESLSRKSNHAGSDGTRTPPVAAAPPGSTAIGQINNSMPPPKLPDAGHLPQYSLRLSELVNRSFIPCAPGAAAPSSGNALAGAAKSAAGKATGAAHTSAPPLSSVVYEGRRLPNRDAIVEIASTVVAELEYAVGVDAYLLRAASRSSLKALSLFADRMDSLVVTSSKDASTLAMPTCAKEGVNPSAALEYNLGLASLEWIVEDALERCIEGPPGSEGKGLPSFVSEILTPVRKKMEATILHIVQPLVASIKTSITATLAKAVVTPFVSGVHLPSPRASQTNALPTSGTVSLPSTPNLTPVASNLSPPAPALGASGTTWIKELEGKMEGARRLLVPRLVHRCGQDGEGWFISIAIHVIWKGLMILSSRAMPPPGPICSKWPIGLLRTTSHLYASDVSKRSPSPAQLSSALKSVTAVPRARKANDARPPGSGISTPGGMQGPPQIGSALANASAKATVAQITEVQAFERIVHKFAAAFLPSRGGSKSSSGRRDDSEAQDDDDGSSSSDDDDEVELARAALAEALQAIRSTMTVIQYLDSNPSALLNSVRSRGRSSSSSNAGNGGSRLPSDAIRAVRALPPLILLHLVYARMPLHLGIFSTQQGDDGNLTPPAIAAPPATFGISWSEYEQSIGGFRSAQSWSAALVREWGQDVEEARADIDAREKARYQISKASRGQRQIPQAQGVAIPSATTSASDADKYLAIGQDEATPTPESVLLQRTESAVGQSDGNSSPRRSSESLPRDMTMSAPTLDREKQKAAREVMLGSSAQPSDGTDSTRMSWSMFRRPSRSPAPSNGVSPVATPDISPPRSPGVMSAETTNNVSSSGRATPRSRFWRTSSSSNTSTLAQSGGASSSQVTPSKSSFMSLSGKSRAGPATMHDSVPSVQTSEEERRAEELHLERESVQLLATALDAASFVCGIASPSAAAQGADAAASASVHSLSSSSSPVMTADTAIGTSCMEQRMSTLSLQSSASQTPSSS